MIDPDELFNDTFHPPLSAILGYFSFWCNNLDPTALHCIPLLQYLIIECKNSTFNMFSELRQVEWNKESAKQSEKCKYGSCSGASKCTAQLAIDGNLDTRSITEYRETNSWWECELKDWYKVKRVELYLSSYAYGKGAYRHLQVNIHLTL